MVEAFVQTIAFSILGLMAVSSIILITGIGACAFEIRKCVKQTKVCSKVETTAS